MVLIKLTLDVPVVVSVDDRTEKLWWPNVHFVIKGPDADGMSSRKSACPSGWCLWK
jgi:hypothetical protein